MGSISPSSALRSAASPRTYHLDPHVLSPRVSSPVAGGAPGTFNELQNKAAPPDPREGGESLRDRESFARAPLPLPPSLPVPAFHRRRSVRRAPSGFSLSSRKAESGPPFLPFAETSQPKPSYSAKPRRDRASPSLEKPLSHQEIHRKRPRNAATNSRSRSSEI